MPTTVRAITPWRWALRPLTDLAGRLGLRRTTFWLIRRQRVTITLDGVVVRRGRMRIDDDGDLTLDDEGR